MIGFLAYLFRTRHLLAISGVLVLVAFVTLGFLAPALYEYSAVTGLNLRNRLQLPSAAFPLGTDEMGRNLLAKIAWGSRITLSVAFTSVLFSVVLGILLGTIAGYYRGIVPLVLVRFIDGIAGFPRVLMAIVLLTIIGPGAVGLVIAIAVSTMPVFARLYYSEVRALKEREFVLAAHTLGARDRDLIVSHILPNTIPMLVVQASICLAEAVLIASGLSFLGLGPQPPTPEWGAMIAASRAQVQTAPHVIIVPGAALFLVVLAFNVIGDALRDYLDPRARRTRRPTINKLAEETA